MPLKIVSVKVGTTKIVVENRWLGGARLLVNDVELAQNKSVFAINKKRVLMSAKSIIDGQEKLIEVFAFALLDVKLKLCVNGEQVAGDSF